MTQFRINRRDFIDALTIGGAMSSKKNTIPILEYAKFRVDDRQVVVSSSDSEVYVTKRVFVESCNAQDDFCMSSTDLLRALKTINEEFISIDIQEKNLEISHERGKMRFPKLPSDEFPTLLKAESLVEITVDCERFYNLVDKARDFIDSKNGTAISGMYLYTKESFGGVCGTDGHKLFSDKFDVLSGGGVCGAVLPVSAIPYILNTINGNEKVSIVFEGKNITFKVPNARINCRTLDLNYPPFERVIPNNNDKILEADISVLKNSVNRAKMFSSNKGGTLLNVNISKNAIGISARDFEENKESSESIEVRYDNEDVSIGLNGVVLSQCLSAIESDTVKIEIRDGEHGILMRDENNPERAVMQMPIVQR